MDEGIFNTSQATDVLLKTKSMPKLNQGIKERKHPQASKSKMIWWSLALSDFNLLIGEKLKWKQQSGAKVGTRLREVFLLQIQGSP